MAHHGEVAPQSVVGRLQARERQGAVHRDGHLRVEARVEAWMGGEHARDRFVEGEERDRVAWHQTAERHQMLGERRLVVAITRAAHQLAGDEVTRARPQVHRVQGVFSTRRRMCFTSSR